MTTSTEWAEGLLNFDQERYLRIQSAAIARGRELGDALAQRQRAGSLEEVVFLGTGGAGILMEPALRLAGRHLSLPVQLRHPAEEVVGQGAFGPGSAVVIPSLSGTTKESIAVLQQAKAQGAWIAVLTAHADSPLATAADLTLVNEEAADDSSSESFYLQSLLGIAGLAAQSDDWGPAASLADRLANLPERLVAVKTAYENQAADAAAFLAARDYYVVTAAGYAWPAAHYYAMCILEEMQWIRTRPVHAAHFFHGTLELMEPGVPLVVIAGRDETRPLTDRVIDFSRTVTDHVLVIDAADADLGELPGEVSAVLTPVVVAALLERVSAHLEVLRDHPLTTRRYYRRMAY